MKLLIATGLYAPQIGGPATHTRMLETHLPSHNIETVVLPYHRFNHLPPVIRHLAYTLQLVRRLRTCDLILAQDIFSVGLPALIASRLTRKRLMVRVPGDYAWEQARERFGITDTLLEFQERHYSLRIELLRILTRLVVRHAYVTVAPSAYMAAIVRRWNPRQLEIIPNGIDIPVGVQAPAPLPSKPFILTASRLVQGKGFACLIDLMAQLPEWHLVIVGSGPLEKELKKAAQESGYESRIVFAGPATPEAMFGWYTAADVFVLNSAFETFSFQVIESLASGTPTIATSVGAIPEVIQQDKEGILVTPDDRSALVAAIESVRTGPERWKQRTEAGRRRAAEFDGKTLGERFAQLCSNVMLDS